MLTFNNERTLARALESVKEVAEVIVSDGGSTDRTREIALAFGCTLMTQDPADQDSSGRLIDYGAARERIRVTATQPWVMQLDSDEYASRELVDDLRRVCVPDTAVTLYTMQAKYEVNGRLVDCATTYPMNFPRLYLKAASSGYSGPTHERALVEGTREALASCFVIPFPPAKVFIPKWLHYLSIDKRQFGGMDAHQLRLAYRHQRSQIRWFLRDLRSKRTRSCQHPLPLRYELLRGVFYVARYSLALAEVATRRLAHRRR